MDFKKTTSIFLILFLIFFKNLTFIEKAIGKEIFNEKTFSGAVMGMGLSKSYEQGLDKICVYNTVNGQEKIVLEDNKMNCPKKYKEKRQK